MDIQKIEQQNREVLKLFMHRAGVPKGIRELVYGLVDGTDFLTAPASTMYHGSYPGGLFKHSMHVATLLIDWREAGVVQFQRGNTSAALVGLLHDWTKVGKYAMDPYSDPDGNPNYSYASNDIYTNYGGHGSDSCIKVLKEVPLTEEEIDCIRWHMGPYEGKEAWPLYEAAIKRFPSVLWTHHADMYASKVFGV